MKDMDKIASIIDHTILKPDVKEEDIIRICNEARENNFASVCINPSFIPVAYEILKDTNVKVCTVIGFPLGATLTEVKAFETNLSIEKGASEVDMVINIGKLKDGDFDYVKNDIEAVVKASNKRALVKVIIETCLLTDAEKEKACILAKKAGADFVKTSTGFSTGGATIDDIALMRKTVGEKMGVKASGGVHSKDDAENMINAGATRIGASSSLKIIQKSNETQQY